MASDTLGSFLKNMLFVYSNQIFLFLIGMLYTFIIANELGPGDYGIFIFLSLFFSNLIYLFGLEMFSSTISVFMPKLKSFPLFSKLLKIQYFVAIILFVLFFIFPSAMIFFVSQGNPELIRLFSFILLLLPGSILFNSLFRGFKLFGKVMKISVVESVSNLLLAMLFSYYFEFGIEGLIYAKLISLVIAILLSVFYKSSIVFENKKFYPKEIINYNKDIFSISTVRKIQDQVLLFYIGFFINPIMMGVYYFIDKIFSYALRIPEATVDEVFLPYLGEKHDDLSVFSNYLSINLKASIALNFVIIVGVVIFLPIIIPLLFPDYLAALPLILFFGLSRLFPYGNPLNNSYKLLNKTDNLVWLSFLSITITVVAGFFLISEYGIWGLIALEFVKKIVSFVLHYYFVKNLGFSIIKLLTPSKNDYYIVKKVIKKVKNKLS